MFVAPFYAIIYPDALLNSLGTRIEPSTGSLFQDHYDGRRVTGHSYLGVPSSVSWY
jgi:hypothetical protein